MGVWKRKDRKPSLWYYSFQIEGERIREYGFITREEAEEAEAKERLRLKRLTSQSSFVSLVDRRLREIHAYVTPLWFKTCQTILQSFEDWFEAPASEITTAMIRERIINIAAERSNHTANRYLVVLKSVFALAVRDGELPRNPAVGIKRLPTEARKKIIPERDAIDTVIAYAEPLQQAYLNTILFTGARVGEINGLTWGDVDFKNRTVTLWTRKKKGGNRKARTVQMVDTVYEALTGLPREPDCPWVYVNPEMKRRYPHEPIKWRYIYRDKFLKTLCRKAGVPVFTYHHLRHYTASALAEAGLPLAAIQSILGHERATTTDLYLQDLGRAKMGLQVLER